MAASGYEEEEFEGVEILSGWGNVPLKTALKPCTEPHLLNGLQSVGVGEREQIVGQARGKKVG